MLNLDSDGVMAGWRKYVERHHLHNVNWEEFHKIPETKRRGIFREIYQKDPDLFYKLDPLPGAELLLEAADRNDCGWRILTSAAEDHPDFDRCKEGKEAWYKKHFGISADRLIVTENSAAKKEYAGRGHLLVDDYRRNCNEWALKGGFALWTLADAPNVEALVQHIAEYQEDPNASTGFILQIR